MKNPLGAMFARAPRGPPWMQCSPAPGGILCPSVTASHALAAHSAPTPPWVRSSPALGQGSTGRRIVRNIEAACAR
eukprot:6168994-Prymnesium_polylepis.1